MSRKNQLRKVFQKIQVVRSPKHRLATFGTSRINYLLVTDIIGLPDRSRLRTGCITAEKPALITPENLKKSFLGFTEEADKYVDALMSQYGNALRGLEYQFRHEPTQSQIELKSPEILLQELTKEFDQSQEFDKAVIQGTERLWELSLMKFIVEETLSSFSVNMQELNERGFFDGEARTLKRRHQEIHNLLQKAAQDKSVIPVLASKLKEFGMFDQYQDAFFKVVNP